MAACLERAAPVTSTGAVIAPRPPSDDGEAISAIEGYIERNPQHGFHKMYPAVRRPSLGKCRLYRVCKALKLNIKRRGKRKSASADQSAARGSREA